MGRSLVETVVDALRADGVRAAKAYPGQRIPHLKDVAVTVSLHRAERGIQAATVLVTVLARAAMGGSVCEPVAVQVIDVLEAMEAECTREGLAFDTTGDCFYIQIFAKFTGLDTPEGWESALPYTIKVGTATMEYVTGFKAGRAMGKDDTSLDGLVWEFELQEMIPPGAPEANPVTEPFTLTLSRGTTADFFQKCIWTSVQRTESRNGTRQVRTGRAQSKTEASVL